MEENMVQQSPDTRLRWLMPGALILAWAVDFLFWGRIPGISFFIWCGLASGLLVFLAVNLKLRTHRLTWLLFAVVLLSAGMTALRMEPLTRFVNGAGALFALVLLANTYTTGHWWFYHLLDYLVRLFSSFFTGLSRLGELFRVHFPEGGKQVSTPGIVLRRACAVLRGLLLVLPILIFFGALLSSADLVFRRQINTLINWFSLENLLEWILRAGLVLTLMCVFSAILLEGLLPRKQPQRPDPSRQHIAPFLGWTETSIILGGVNLLFLLFVVIQFRYLFGGDVNMQQFGLDYSTYARRGFAELVAVAVFSILLAVSLGVISQRKTITRIKLFSAFLILLFLQVIVILVSSFQRLALYETVFGFTRLRMYTHVFIICLALLLLVLIAMELFEQRGRFGLALLGFAYAFSLALGVINVDGMIVRLNVLHAAHGNELDYTYLRSLSTDMVPALLHLQPNPDISRTVHADLTALLTCARYDALEAEQPDWRSLHLSPLQARIALQNWQVGLQEGFTVHVRRGEVFTSSPRASWACHPVRGWD